MRHGGLQVFEKRGRMRYLIIFILVLFTNCGLIMYKTTYTLPDGKEVKVESNVPASVEGDGYKIDQRGLSIIEKLIPQGIKIEK